MNQTSALLGTDGASQEGIEYWSYGVGAMIDFNDMVRAAGLPFADFMQTSFFKNTSRYQIYLSTPKNSWNAMTSANVDEADATRDAQRADVLMRRFATEYNDGYAQAYSDLAQQNFVETGSTYWEECYLWEVLLNLNPSVAPTAMSGLPP